MRKTTGELEQELGAQIRSLRRQAKRTQADVARDAGISVSTLHSLEHGSGSTVTTLVSVLRALQREEWLATAAPTAEFSPLAALRAARGSRPRRTTVR